MTHGVNWAVENGYGTEEDIKNTEENGCMPGADPSKVSDLAKKGACRSLAPWEQGIIFLRSRK